MATSGSRGQVAAKKSAVRIQARKLTVAHLQRQAAAEAQEARAALQQRQYEAEKALAEELVRPRRAAALPML